MLDTLCHLLYVSINKHEKGRNSSIFQSFIQDSEQKTETLDSDGFVSLFSFNQSISPV